MIPLYENAAAHAAFGKDTNAGLWYDKFCDSWTSDYKKFEKTSWIRKLSGKSVGDGKVLAEHAARRRALASACGGLVMEWKTSSRFMTGLGRDHPVENGFAWQHLLGVPYLPGSGVKGVIRSWACTWGGVEDDALCQRVFGAAADASGSDDSVGGIIFLDAIPIAPVQLQGEVMTPHLGGYYLSSTQDIDENLPGEWHAPVPIPLLATAPGQTFQFCLMPRTAKDRDLLPMVADLLAEALQMIGAGAKTANGYGRFDCAAPGGATSVKPAQDDPLERFIRWFKAHKFQTKDKGTQPGIIEQIEALPETMRPQAKEYVKGELPPKARTGKIREYLA